MRTNPNYASLAALVLAVSLAAAPVAVAEVITMKAELKGSNQVPPVETKASGSATLSYDTVSKRLTWKINYSGLSGNATAAHFHGPAEAGTNAKVAVPIPNISPNTEGSATLTDEQATDLLAGRYYINVHTAANKSGEIRGQVAR
jgi:hypothetical protein